MKLNAEQIIKALECCVTPRDCDCDDCPLDKYGSLNCKWLLMSHSLALIKELNEENEELLEKNSNLHAACWELRADTVREMQERLKAELAKYTLDSFQLFANSFIDQIAKEMTTDEA